MTAGTTSAPAGPARTVIRPFSRIYGLGSVYAKTLRDSRLSVIVVAGLMGVFLISGGAAFGEAYSTPASRQGLVELVKSLPPVMIGVYGNPFPVNMETLGGSLGWKTAASLGLIASIWSILALSGTLAAEARRGSLDLIAVTPLGVRRIAIEKLAAHLTGMAVVVAVTSISAWIAGAAFNTLPGDEIAFADAVSYGLWVGLVGLASGSVAFALAPLVGRGASAAIAGAIMVLGYFLNGYRAAVPAFEGPANLTWFGWTVHHQPLAAQTDTITLIPVAFVAIVLFALGVELFSRRDLGVTSHVPWPRLPAALLGTGGPLRRSFGERFPLAVSWGLGIGLLGFVFGAASLSLTAALAEMSPETRAIYEAIFPSIDLTGAGAFLQLAFITFGLVLAGFAAATLVGGWASDETEGRLETLLSTPMSRTRWVIHGGLGLYAAIVLMTLVVAVGIGIGSALAGGDVVTPILGTSVIGLYALALAGIGVAVGGLLRTSFAGEVVAAIVILSFVLDLVAPALRLPDWVHKLALSTHLGQPMIGNWDWAGMTACVVIAIVGLGLATWGLGRRDLRA